MKTYFQLIALYLLQIAIISKLCVAGVVSFKHSIYCYDIERDVWEKHPHSGGVINNLCIVGDYTYAINSDCNRPPQRYSFAERQWQSFAKVNSKIRYNSGATGSHSKVYLLNGTRHQVLNSGGYYRWSVKNAVLHCFDPVRKVWEIKAPTCQPHFGSSLFVVNNKIYVAGGKVDYTDGKPCGNPGLHL